MGEGKICPFPDLGNPLNPSNWIYPYGPDRDRCYRGLGRAAGQNCFTGRHKTNVVPGCQWWHFTPDSDEEILKAKYDQILEEWRRNEVVKV